MTSMPPAAGVRDAAGCPDDQDCPVVIFRWRPGGQHGILAQRIRYESGVCMADHRIEFSCMYCGHRVRANEEQAGETTTCPACGHSVTVRNKEPGEALKPAPARAASARQDMQDWRARSDQEVIDRLLARALPVKDRRRITAGRLRRLPIPRGDDVTVFALSLTFSWLWLINPGPADDLREAFSLLRLTEVRFVPALTILAATIALINLLLRRPKSDREEFMMMLFTVAVAMGTGIHAGRIAIQEHLGGWVIFPAWSLASGILLLLLFCLGLADSDSMSRKAGLFQALLSAISVAVLLTICQYRLDLHWAITFSIVICYVTSLHNTIRGVFIRRPPASAAYRA
jgi:DNA-directed RNA polymerase subunit RPC12/RpoP